MRFKLLAIIALLRIFRDKVKREWFLYVACPVLGHEWVSDDHCRRCFTFVSKQAAIRNLVKS